MIEFIYFFTDKPECFITQVEVEDEKVLICTANANPTEVSPLIFNIHITHYNDII